MVKAGTYRSKFDASLPYKAIVKIEDGKPIMRWSDHADMPEYWKPLVPYHYSCIEEFLKEWVPEANFPVKGDIEE